MSKSESPLASCCISVSSWTTWCVQPSCCHRVQAMDLTNIRSRNLGRKAPIASGGSLRLRAGPAAWGPAFFLLLLLQGVERLRECVSSCCIDINFSQPAFVTDPLRVQIMGGSSLMERVRDASRRVCVFITAAPVTKLFAWGEGDSGGHVLRAEACVVGPVRNPVL